VLGPVPPPTFKFVPAPLDDDDDDDGDDGCGGDDDGARCS